MVSEVLLFMAALPGAAAARWRGVVVRLEVRRW